MNYSIYIFFFSDKFHQQTIYERHAKRNMNLKNLFLFIGLKKNTHSFLINTTCSFSITNNFNMVLFFDVFFVIAVEDLLLFTES